MDIYTVENFQAGRPLLDIIELLQDCYSGFLNLSLENCHKSGIVITFTY